MVMPMNSLRKLWQRPALRIDASLRRRQTDYQEAAEITRKLKFNRGNRRHDVSLSNTERKLGNLALASKDLKVGLDASRRVDDRYYLPRDLTAMAELDVALTGPSKPTVPFRVVYSDHLRAA